MTPTLAELVAEPSATRNRPAIRRANFDDYEQIAAIEASNGLTTKSREEWMHLWLGNPAYRATHDWPIGWVLEDPDGAIVGTLTNIPCEFRFRGRSYVGAFGRGWAVEPQYRAFSLWLLLHQFQQRNVDIRMTSTAGPQTASLLTTLGWSRVPVGQWDRSALWVASYSRAVRNYLAAKAPRALSSMAASLLSPALRLGDSLLASSRAIGSGLELKWCSAFDQRFDDFWIDLQRQQQDVLLTARSREALTWHFGAALASGTTWVLTASEGSRLAAYAIFERRVSRAVGIHRMLLVDFVSLTADPNIRASIIDCALRRCREEGVEILENIGCWFEEKHTRALRASYHRELGGWCYLYHAPNRELAHALATPNAWYPTQYDADASL